MSVLSLIDDAYALITGANRSIGTIIPEVVVEEIHRDQLIVTEHPVEHGATISDHAFKRPSQIEMRCAWSDSTAGSEGHVQEVYQELLDLQLQREPFDVSTGKRLYSNMLIDSLGVTTDEKSEHALMVVVGLKEVIIVNTETTGVPLKSQANPASTGSVTDAGTKQLKDAATGRAIGPGV